MKNDIQFVIELAKEQMTAMHLTQSQLAEKIGVSPDTLRKWFQFVNEPRYSDVVNIADALAIELKVIDKTMRKDEKK